MATDLRPRSLFTWLATGHFANDCSVDSLWIIAPAAAFALGYGPAEVGLLIFLTSGGAALGYVPAGILADRVRRQGRLLLLSCVWVAVGYACASLATDFWTLALLLALAGLGDAAWHPIATGVLVRQTPGRRAEALGLHAIGGSLAGVAAPVAMGVVIAAFDWRTAVLVAGIPAALMAVAFLFVQHRIPQATAARISRADLGAMRRLWTRPRGLALIVTICLYNMALMGVLAMMPVLLRDVYGFGPETYGLTFAGVILAAALVQPVFGRISDIVGRRRVAVTGNVLGAAGALAVWQSGGSLIFAVAALVVGVMALDAIRSSMLASAVDYAGEREATNLGFAFTIMDGVGALGAWFAGLAGAVDIHHAFAVSAVLSLCSAAGAALVLQGRTPASDRASAAPETP
jgi:FSR family fosmidomycin resistance protein-like MFS transporter